jgi:hypothetical protein
MRRWRVVVLMATALAFGCVWALGSGGAASVADPSERGPEDEPSGGLQIYYTAPVLARAGERVTIPVDVVCTTGAGTPCNASATLGIREAGGGWREASAPARPRLVFDVTAPAARAVAGESSGSVEYFLRAEDEYGRTVSLPAGGSSTPLRFFVTDDMPVVHVPAIPFGAVRKGDEVVFLPWGTGPLRAGLSLGNESQTLGPSGFHVGGDGTIHLADPLQDRVATFSNGRLVGEVPIELGARAGVAIGEEGTIHVLDKAGGTVAVRRIDRSDGIDTLPSLGEGVLGALRSVGSSLYAYLLPLDAWVDVSAGEGSKVSVGIPIGSGQRLLRVGRDEYVRLALEEDGRVSHAVELRSDSRLGGVLLAEPDGEGGFTVVVHVARDAPFPADHYQVIHVADGKVVSTFAVGDSRFAETPPLSRFRLGSDGRLYQLTTSPDGMRIVRFDVEEGGR